MRIAVVGEALIDFTATTGLTFEGHEGGSQANSAIAAARLGQPSAFISQLSTDLFGERLVAWLEKDGVDTSLVLRTAAPSTLAFVERQGAVNRYAFYNRGTADTLWAPEVLPVLPDSCRFLQFGSILLLHDPASSRIVDLVKAQRGKRIVVFDPNIRPSLVDDMASLRERVMGWAALCNVMKLSDEDAAHLAPGVSLADLAQSYLAVGPQAVVVTRGAEGATLYRTGHAPMNVKPPPVQVVDTIGAGDTFSAGLSVGLIEQRVERVEHLHAMSDLCWRNVMNLAAMAASLNCTRVGAQPPSRDEVREALKAMG
ncbi:MAG: ribokinase [Rhizobacter sp.]|nr:ribokinase [Rhizobacter sp.]